MEFNMKNLLPILLITLYFGHEFVFANNFCFKSVTGIDGHCLNKTWSKTDGDVPAGCQCVVGDHDPSLNGTTTYFTPGKKPYRKYGCSCNCTAPEKECVISRTKPVEDKEKFKILAFCKCKNSTKNDIRESYNVTTLGECIRKSGAGRAPFANVFLPITTALVAVIATFFR